MRHCFLRPAALVGSVLIAMCSTVPGHAETRAVIELFTSQGCSSCPAADRLLGELAKDPTIVAMSLSIDYWDYLGWKDTLALPGHANRQRAYARVRGDREVYTPQIVVNGVAHVLGSDKNAIENAISHARRNTAPLPLAVNLAVGSDKLTVTVPAGKDDKGSGEVWLCALTKTVPVAIGRGENNGRTITYNNVARRWIKLGDWSGKSETLTASLADIRAIESVDAVAVFVQGGTAAAPGIILGAAQASLN
jgi:hypothetical protein